MYNFRNNDPLIIKFNLEEEYSGVILHQDLDVFPRGSYYKNFPHLLFEVYSMGYPAIVYWPSCSLSLRGTEKSYDFSAFTFEDHPKKDKIKEYYLCLLRDPSDV